MVELGLLLAVSIFATMIISIWVFRKKNRETKPPEKASQENLGREKAYSGIKNRYLCTGCANKGSPLCRLCKVIRHTDGTETKPSYYVSIVNIPLTDALRCASISRTAATEMVIARYLEERAPIPTALVMEYNKLHENEIKEIQIEAEKIL